MILGNYLNNDWEKYLKNELEKEYFKKIEDFLNTQIKLEKTIYPKKEDIFSVFNKLKLKEIKVVIIWQDPYHWEKQAHWLSFSVQKWIKIPPSLRNIFKEIWKEGEQNWNLEYLVKQWVFLLNSILTVEKAKPASHSKIWWETFTNMVIKSISKEKKWVIFLLWWAFAQKKKVLIDEKKHYILETTHPSPFSSYRWFLWSNCFIKTNEILKKLWEKEIDW